MPAASAVPDPTSLPSTYSRTVDPSYVPATACQLPSQTAVASASGDAVIAPGAESIENSSPPPAPVSSAYDDPPQPAEPPSATRYREAPGLAAFTHANTVSCGGSSPGLAAVFALPVPSNA